MNDRFTATELYCMARLAGKARIYGLPDVLSGIPEEKQLMILHQWDDALVQRGIAAVNMDGETVLDTAYMEIPDIYCECDCCMTMVCQHGQNGGRAHIFWRRDKQIYAAEAIGRHYLLSTSTAEEVRNCCSVEWEDIGGKSEEILQSEPIPQSALRKAKRAIAAEDHDGAIRILRENGADQRLAGILCSGLEEKADYVGMLLMRPSGEKVDAKEVMWLHKNGICLTARKAVVNYRSCITFMEASASELTDRADAIVADFLCPEL